MRLSRLFENFWRLLLPTGVASRVEAAPYVANTSKLTTRLLDVLLRTYDLGFTAFGGPPVHFQIFHRRFVDGLGKTPWIDEQTYQELFAISQALPGPASTKMLFNIAQIHAGIIPAVFVFLLWSLPAGFAMYGLALGIRHVGDTLPGPAYALLSGLNAATVGIIALASVQLARKAITDPLTRILVAFGACAGLCYSTLWYFPVLLVIAGVVTVYWDIFGHIHWRFVNNVVRKFGRRKSIPAQPEAIEAGDIPMEDAKSGLESPPDDKSTTQRRQVTSGAGSTVHAIEMPTSNSLRIDISAHGIPIKVGLSMIMFFFAIFAIFMSLRGALRPTPLLLALFNNMLLAGTIIFGGGPVVIPLLRDYVVVPGWVTPRDFLLGIAVIQAMPGPNFNVAIYLGALAANGRGYSTVVGAILAYIGIFTPGLWLSIAFQSLWRNLRKRREVLSILRGINAAAVGFVYTAVYRLWEIGYLTPQSTKGVSLGQDPWWLVIAASTFTSVEWFRVPPPLAILTGGAAGLAWWGVVGHRKGV